MHYCRKHELEIKFIMRSGGLSKNQTYCLSGHLARLEQYMGPKGLVETLKDRTRALIEDRADHFKSRDGYWIGPFRPVHKIAKRGRTGLDRAVSILRLYGCFMARPATEKTYVKLARELSAPPDYVGYDALRYPRRFTKHFKGIHHFYDDIYPMSTRKTPLGNRSVPEFQVLPVDYIRSMDHFPKHVEQFYNYYKLLVGEGLPCIEHYREIARKKERLFYEDRPYRLKGRSRKSRGTSPYLSRNDVAGRVTILNKDGALKQRQVANANRILQLACSPVHNFTMALLREYPSSYVFDQLKGVEWISTKLRLGWTFSSIDLKSASDNIPLGLQIRFLKEMVPSLSTPLEVFYEVSRMEYLTPYIRPVVWSCGSPMGVKGSFGLFTVYLMSLLEHVGAHGSYAIVGDDIVVKSDFTAPVLCILGNYGVPISKQKSLFDHFRFAEFCGKIIDQLGPFKSNKATKIDLIKNPTGLLRQFGKRALRFLPQGKLTYAGILTLVHFHKYEQMGVIDAIRILASKDEEPDPVNPGGLSYSQLIRLIPSKIPKDDREILSKDVRLLNALELDLVQKLLWSHSIVALTLLQEQPKRMVSAWKFKIMDRGITCFDKDGAYVASTSKTTTMNLIEPWDPESRGLHSVVQNEVDLLNKKEDPGPFRRSLQYKLTWSDVRYIVSSGYKVINRLRKEAIPGLKRIKHFLAHKLK